MSIKSVHFSLSVPKVDKKNIIPERQSEVCNFIDRSSVYLPVRKHRIEKGRAGDREAVAATHLPCHG